MNNSTRKMKIHRAFPRRSASAAVNVTCQKKATFGQGPNLSSVVLDLSQAGARLLVTAPLAVGEKVVLGLEEPSYNRPLIRDGKVVWSFQVTKRGYAVGLCLDEPLGADDIQQVTIHPVRLDY
jgi:positive regulator of sigma E activity